MTFLRVEVLTAVEAMPLEFTTGLSLLGSDGEDWTFDEEETSTLTAVISDEEESVPPVTAVGSEDEMAARLLLTSVQSVVRMLVRLQFINASRTVNRNNLKLARKNH